MFGLAIFLFMPAISSAADEPETDRFLVHSQNGWLKTILGVQNEFSDGFTTDAVYAKRSLLNFLAARWGFSVEPVPKYRISQNLISGIIEPAKTNKAPRLEPLSQVPWGVAWYDGVALSPKTGPVTVAVIDTGTDKDHPDLVRRVKECFSFTNGATPWPSCTDSNGHGTHLAGIIAADSGLNGKGIWGMAPGTNLAIYKACDSNGWCFADDLAAALRFAADAKVNVATLGIKVDIFAPLLTDALEYAATKGVLVIGPGAVSVAAFDAKGKLAPTTTLSPTFLAPGVEIESTAPNKSYVVKSGDSMAIGHLAGLAARIWAGSAKATLAALSELLN